MRLAAIKSLGDDLSAAIILAASGKEEEAMEGFSKVLVNSASGKLTGMLLTYEEYAEWIAMGIAAGGIGLIYLNKWAKNVLAPKKAPPAQREKTPPRENTEDEAAAA